MDSRWGKGVRLMALLGLATGLCGQEPTGWYGGGSLGRANLRIPGRDMELEGIRFSQVNASADRAGVKFYAGYWITEHFGMEAGIASLGNVNATFNYFLPPTESGTGTTKVAISNGTLSFQGAQQVGRFLLFLRGGIQGWTLSYETRFRLSTGELQWRTLDKNGNSFFWGAGVEWTLRGPWRLRLEGEVLKMDITDAKVISLGVSYRPSAPRA